MSAVLHPRAGEAILAAGGGLWHSGVESRPWPRELGKPRLGRTDLFPPWPGEQCCQGKWRQGVERGGGRGEGGKK